jgi:dephospho-CoA kinase
VVFQDPTKRKILEEIVHPRVAEAKDKRLRELQCAGHRIAVVDVPLLFESGWNHLCDLVIVVYVPASVQLERLMQRDHMPLEEARSRLVAQMPIEDKRKLADRVVDNSGTPEETKEQVRRLWEELERLARSKEASADPRNRPGLRT